jgi:hypothetical protein
MYSTIMLHPDWPDSSHLSSNHTWKFVSQSAIWSTGNDRYILADGKCRCVSRTRERERSERQRVRWARPTRVEGLAPALRAERQRDSAGSSSRASKGSNQYLAKVSFCSIRHIIVFPDRHKPTIMKTSGSYAPLRAGTRPIRTLSVFVRSVAMDFVSKKIGNGWKLAENVRSDIFFSNVSNFFRFQKKKIIYDL